MDGVYYTTRQVAQKAGVHRDTLLRWLRKGRITEPERDRNNWRVFTPQETENIVRYAGGTGGNPSGVLETSATYSNPHPYADSVTRLQLMDWDFAGATTGFLTHGLHPYPAKFIPQIPNALIQELSSIGETIFDPFCGSGTTLVEALRLGRCAIGTDANPLACLISIAKTSHIGSKEAEELRRLAEEAAVLGQQAYIGTLPLFPDLPLLPTSENRPTFDGVDDWFDAHIIEELALIREKCLALQPLTARNLALVAFSSIIVTVSRQDSDTRYVRREKNIKPGDTLVYFQRALTRIIQRVLEFSEECGPDLSVKVIEADILNAPEIGSVDLVICSPPYPNAYSYHLYHRTRMLWLGMDQPQFKAQEIGSHRKYSRKGPNAATAETFRDELHTILTWLARQLRPNRHACFVIGDSTIKGEVIKNDELLMDVAHEIGFQVEGNITRRLQDTKKHFNPTIGKIKDEHVVILRNTGAVS